MHRQVMTSLAALLLAGSAASAAEFELNDTGQTWFASPSGSAAPLTITQNLDITVIETGSVACGVGDVSTVDNQYLRRFLLSTDHGIVDEFTVESVDFAVQEVSSAAGGGGIASLTVEFNIYSIASGDAFTYANMTLEDTATIDLFGTDEGTFLNVPIGGVFSDPTATDLVVEVAAGDFTAAALSFRLGSNSLGATRDAYIASNTCSIVEPTPVSAIGFSESQYLFIVNGEEESTVPTEDATWSEVKSLF